MKKANYNIDDIAWVKIGKCEYDGDEYYEYHYLIETRGGVSEDHASARLTTLSPTPSSIDTYEGLDRWQDFALNRGWVSAYYELTNVEIRMLATRRGFLMDDYVL